jgi:calcineurin-like phosphoesterase family protein
MAIFLTADWHLGATDIRLLGRPFLDTFDMGSSILREHNRIVAPGDTVYMLGDVIHKGADVPTLAPLLDVFNGNLVLVRGNHDDHSPAAMRELERYFVEVIPEGDGVELNIDGLACWLTHYPVRSRTDRFNLVGHIHDRWKVQKNMLNVGVDVHHFRPVSERDVRFYFDAICGFYDEDVWVADHPANAVHHDRGAPGTYLATRGWAARGGVLR